MRKVTGILLTVFGGLALIGTFVNNGGKNIITLLVTLLLCALFIFSGLELYNSGRYVYDNEQANQHRVKRMIFGVLMLILGAFYAYTTFKVIKAFLTIMSLGMVTVPAIIYVLFIILFTVVTITGGILLVLKVDVKNN
ncbi:MAG: hypothetical protein E7583_05025 [Ruminococcaceae bacterium]|nr:hypothetical protein [Oscillospiraceae bacterium]